jgi:hypothetical protein
MAESQPSKIRQRKRRQLRRWTVLILVLALCGWAARFAYLRLALRPTPRWGYWEAQLAELDPPPPGALSPREAEAVLVNTPWYVIPNCPQDVLGLLRGNWDESEVDMRALDSALASQVFIDARAAVLEAARAGWQNIIRAGQFNHADPLWKPCFDWSRWLVVHARWSLERRADHDAAINDWVAVLEIGRQIRRSGDLMSMSYETACSHLAAAAMMQQAGEGNIAVDTVAVAGLVDTAIGPLPTPERLLAGERIRIHSWLESIYVRRGRGWLDVSEAVALQAGTPVTRLSRLWNLTSPVFHDYEQARRRADRSMGTLLTVDSTAAARKVIHAVSGSSLGPLDGTLPQRQNWYPSREEAIAWTLYSHYALRTGLDAALTLFAVREFHRQKQRYPATLRELVPEFLPRMPVDYADRRPLRYRLRDEDFLLYSIGPDGKDDGGNGRAVNTHRTAPEFDGDIAFRAIRRSEGGK